MAYPTHSLEYEVGAGGRVHIKVRPFDARSTQVWLCGIGTVDQWPFATVGDGSIATINLCPMDFCDHGGIRDEPKRWTRE